MVENASWETKRGANLNWGPISEGPMTRAIDSPPIAFNLAPSRARSRPPSRFDSGKLDGVPTPARGGVPPRGDFDPLELDIIRGEIAEESAGRERFGRLSKIQLREIAVLFARYGFYTLNDIQRTHDKARN